MDIIIGKCKLKKNICLLVHIGIASKSQFQRVPIPYVFHCFSDMVM